MGVAPISVPQPLAYAIDTAGDKSAVDFDYLLQTAIRESSLNPTAKAGTSSATGLFQFLDSTWLMVMKQEGPRLGYGKYADAIKVDKDGDYYIADKQLKAEVLKLRENPQVASDLAAAYTRSNGDYLYGRFGRMPSPGELYIAHFLGANGAAKFFDAGLADPNQSAAALFPRQARANATIFYDHGKPRSIKAVYQVLVAKHDGAPPASIDSGFSAQQLSAAPQGKWPDAEPLPSRFGPDDMSFTALFSNEGEVQGRTLISPAEEAQGAALFTQLYGQGQAAPLVNGE
ncbi:MAG: transglycosylase SLT domain-containing protein [Devosia sp.]